MRIGRTPSRANGAYWGAGHPWLSIADMNQGSQLWRTKETITDKAARDTMTYSVMPGTVLLSFKLSLGKVGIARVPMYTNEAIAALPIRDEEVLDAAYLAWALRSLDLALGANRAAMGATLNKAKLTAARVPLPPLDEQRRIARILDTVEHLRAKRARSIEAIDSFAEAIFRDLFALSCAPQKTLGDLLARIDSGKSPVCASRPAANGEWGVLKLGAISFGRYTPRENKALLPDTQPVVSLEVRAGDVLLTRKNTRELVGASVYVEATPPRLLLPDLMFRLVPAPYSQVRPVYLHAVLMQPRTRRAMARVAGGSAGSMPNISKARLRTIQIPVPPLADQVAYERLVARSNGIRGRLVSHLAELDALFASVEQRAFNGAL